MRLKAKGCDFFKQHYSSNFLLLLLTFLSSKNRIRLGKKAGKHLNDLALWLAHLLPV
jgi:hypothetical protein